MHVVHAPKEIVGLEHDGLAVGISFRRAVPSELVKRLRDALATHEDREVVVEVKRRYDLLIKFRNLGGRTLQLWWTKDRHIVVKSEEVELRFELDQE